MPSTLRRMAVLFLACLTPAAWAELDNRDVRIVEVQLWQGNSPLYLQLSNGTWCYVPNGEDAMLSAVMSAYFNASTVTAVCADRTDNFHGVGGHRLFHLRLRPQSAPVYPTRGGGRGNPPPSPYPQRSR